VKKCTDYKKEGVRPRHNKRKHGKIEKRLLDTTNKQVE